MIERISYPVRYLRRADWGHGLAVIAIPILIIAALGHRYGNIETGALFVILAVAFVLALLGLMFSISAILVVWRQGHRGASAAMKGIAYGLISLALPAIAVLAFAFYPKLHDISTDVIDPPGIRGNAVFDDKTIDAQRMAYPDLVPRRFTVDTEELANAALKAVERVGWTVTDRSLPSQPGEPGVILAEHRTLVFAFVDDITVRVLPDPIGSLLDLRSRSRVGAHDLGENARHMRRYLTELDAVLIEAFGETDPATAE